MTITESDNSARSEALNAKERERKIIHTSYVGIGGNVLLVIFKMAVGLLANSIAVVLDAINNLTDALSSVITIVGAKLSNRRPNKAHPYGYGRIEYLTSMVISVIILYAGITSLFESVKKVIWPGEPDYSTITLIVIIAGIAIKVVMGIYVKRVGERINASPLVASGKDALFDSVLSAGTLLAAILSLGFGINIDGIIGTLISAVIVKGGFDILRESVDSVLGERPDPELSHELKAFIKGFDGVQGVYDLSIDDFGPNRSVGSVHIEVPDNMTARGIHVLTRRISEQAYVKFGIILTVGVYAANTTGKFGEMRKKLEGYIAECPEIVQMHGFYVDEDEKICTFDLIVDFDHDAQKTADKIKNEMRESYPDYTFDAVLDTDVSDD